MAPKKQGARVLWAPVQQTVPVVPTTAVAALPAEEDGVAGSETASIVSTSTNAEDSLHSEADGPDAAVAASGSGNRPPTMSKARLHAPRRGFIGFTKEPAKWDAVAATLDEAEVVGNIGWLFGNWGKRPSNRAMREHLDMVLKRNPAWIIGLAECEEASEDLLAGPAVAGDPNAPEVSLERRDGFAYLTLRGCEDSSVLVAVRNETGNRLDLLDWERRSCGKGKKGANDAGGDASMRTFIRIREKRLLAALWMCGGKGYKGSHFPICAFTKNVGRRSPERMRVRAERAAAKREQSQLRQPWPRQQPWQEQQQHGQGQEQQLQQAAAAATAAALTAAATAAAEASTAARGWLDYGDDWVARRDSWRPRGWRDCGDDGWRDYGDAVWRAGWGSP